MPSSDRTPHPPSRTPACSRPGCYDAPRGAPSPRSAPHRRRRQPSRRQRPPLPPHARHDPRLAAEVDQLLGPWNAGACPRQRLPSTPHHRTHARHRHRDQSRLRRTLTPPTGNTQRVAPASRSAATTPISPATRSPTSTPSKTPSPLLARHRRPPLPRRARLRQRYRRLVDHARQLQRQAGYANANLKRGLTGGRAI